MSWQKRVGKGLTLYHIKSLDCSKFETSADNFINVAQCFLLCQRPFISLFVDLPLSNLLSVDAVNVYES